jgi:PDZ domain-containing secreted protein
MIVEVDKTPRKFIRILCNNSNLDVSPFWDKLYCGDVLSALNGRPIKSLHDFYKRIEHLQSPISLTVERPLKITEVSRARLRSLKIDPTSTSEFFSRF